MGPILWGIGCYDSYDSTFCTQKYVKTTGVLNTVENVSITCSDSNSICLFQNIVYDTPIGTCYLTNPYTSVMSTTTIYYPYSTSLCTLSNNYNRPMAVAGFVFIIIDIIIILVHVLIYFCERQYGGDFSTGPVSTGPVSTGPVSTEILPKEHVSTEPVETVLQN
jgi:hypothetical protein